MENERDFMYILDLCGNLNIEELKGLIDNIEIMIENLEEELENGI